MEAFISGIIAAMSGIFTGLLEALAGVGDVIFKISEAGAITGITPFGWFSVTLIGLPLGTWLFSKFMGLFNKLFRK